MSSSTYVSSSVVSSTTEEKKESSYMLPPLISFGFHRSHHSDQMKISDNGQHASKTDPETVYAKGVVYSEKPIKGDCEFEIEITSYGTSWSGNVKLGVMVTKSSKSLTLASIPRYTPESNDHCVWCATKLHDHVTPMAEVAYGHTGLDELREGDKLGMRLTSKGILQFFVNGTSQGVATRDIYKPGHDVYIVVDHYANCKATKITRAIMREDSSLQEKCLDRIASFLKSQDHVDKLPIPNRMRDLLKDYNYPGINS